MWCWTPVAIIGLCWLQLHSADMSINEMYTSLRHHLLETSHLTSRPSRHNQSVIATVKIELQHFDYNERQSTFHFVGVMHVKWHDHRLIWKPQHFANISRITISPYSIWVPDLEFYNNAPNKLMQMHRKGLVMIHNDGIVLWSDTIEISMVCSSFMKNWPHVIHKCQHTLGSWTYDGLELDFNTTDVEKSLVFSPSFSQGLHYKVTEFDARHSSTVYACCPEPYVWLSYNLTFERNSEYAVLFRSPAITVMVCILLSLALDERRSEKFWLNALCLWLICAHLIYFALRGNLFAKDTPNIVIFFNICLVLSTLNQLLGVFTAYVMHTPYTSPMPRPVLWFLKTTLALKLVPTSDIYNEGLEDANSRRHGLWSQRNDWIRLVELLRRLALISYALIFVILSTVCFV